MMFMGLGFLLKSIWSEDRSYFDDSPYGLSCRRFLFHMFGLESTWAHRELSQICASAEWCRLVLSVFLFSIWRMDL